MPTPENKDEAVMNNLACAIEMLDGARCGRPIYAAPAGIDKEPVCMMHSLDPAKNVSEFWRETDGILQTAVNEAFSQRRMIADFTEFAFPEASFSNREFLPACHFMNAIFLGNAVFDHAVFNGTADFVHCSFGGEADFSCAKFCQSADFSASLFSRKAYFTSANFSADTRFLNSEFREEVRFDRAVFGQSADFWHATFHGEVWFDEARIRGLLRFQETAFEQQMPNDPSLRFCEVEIENPKQVHFYHTNLSQALFYHTDISEFSFSLVTWSNRGAAAGPDRIGMCNGEPRRQCLFEERVALGPHSFHRLELSAFENDPNERNYKLIAETYRQLKRNYDAKGDYWTAGHWHYGESYMRPLLWLIFFVATFAFLYPIAGLEFNSSTTTLPGWLGYADWATFFSSHSAEHPAGFFGMILHSLMTSLSVAGFQRELRYAPSYPWGRMLALLELLLTTTLGGLFLLAIRRQFKRS